MFIRSKFITFLKKKGEITFFMQSAKGKTLNALKLAESVNGRPQERFRCYTFASTEHCISRTNPNWKLCLEVHLTTKREN